MNAHILVTNHASLATNSFYLSHIVALLHDNTQFTDKTPIEAHQGIFADIHIMLYSCKL